MAAYTPEQLDAIAAQFVRRIFVERNLTAIEDVPGVKAVLDAVNTWADDNAASYNSALPLNFRTNASPELKAMALAMVCLDRAGLL